MAFADDTGWYAGFNAGQSRASIDDARIANGLLGAGLTTAGISDDDRHFGFKVFGGYEFNRYLALEAGYFDLGQFGFTATTIPAGTLHGDIKVRGANFDAVGMVPLSDNFSLFARAGLTYANSRDAFAGTGAVAVINAEPHQFEPNYKLGLGAQYNFTELVGMRIEAERYRIDDAVGNKGDIDLYSVGLVFRFGRAAPRPAPRAAAPEPVVETVPEPMAVPPPPPPPPPPPVRRKVSFSSDELFDFAKDTVRPAGKQALDRFAAEMNGTRFEVITITGYTDRIGSHEYNMKLSTRRAEAVKSYLEQSGGIPADKMTAVGADGSAPMTTHEECPGERRTPKLIACLQPDRRVDVEVVGTQKP